MQLQPELREPLTKLRQEPPRILFVLETHDKVSSRAGSHRPALSEPDLNLSTHPAPIAQPSGRAPSRQCANRRGDR
jgi:hypothetical protein